MPKNKTMRITGGSLVRRQFLVPETVDDGSTRPTPDRVREAVFSMLMPYLASAYVLDLFAGSGAHGFESISRGARTVRFLEKNPRVSAIIKESAVKLGIADLCQIDTMDVIKAIEAEPTAQADIIFLDPPYAIKLDEAFFARLARHLAHDGVVVFRCFKKESPAIGEYFSIIRDRIYGGTRVFLLTLP